jgi:hypothetical protein
MRRSEQGGDWGSNSSSNRACGVKAALDIKTHTPKKTPALLFFQKNPSGLITKNVFCFLPRWVFSIFLIAFLGVS